MQKETKAATRIQANFRGHKTRKELAGQGGREDEEEVYPNDENDDCPGELRLVWLIVTGKRDECVKMQKVS